MQEKNKKGGKNENKSLKEKNIKELLRLTFAIGGHSLQKQEKMILEEVLINGRTFASIESTHDASPSLQKYWLKNALKKLFKSLQQAENIISSHAKIQNDDMLNLLTKTQEDLADARYKLEELKESVRIRMKLPADIQQLLETPIEQLEFTARVKNVCRAYDIDTLSKLASLQKAQFMQMRNAGKNAAGEVEVFLLMYGLSWSMKI